MMHAHPIGARRKLDVAVAGDPSAFRERMIGAERAQTNDRSEPRFGLPAASRDMRDELAELLPALRAAVRRDRKSTRLNSSHLVISYAVFCLKKKNNFIYVS